METNLSAESSQETLRNLDKEDIIKSIRSKLVITPCLRSSLQECKVELNLAKLKGLQKFYKNTEIKVKVTEGLIYVLRQLISVDSDLTNLPSGFLNFHDAYDLFCGLIPNLAISDSEIICCTQNSDQVCLFFKRRAHDLSFLENHTFDLSKFFIELETLESKEEEKKRKNKLSQQFLHQAINALDTEYDKMTLKAILCFFLDRKNASSNNRD